MAFQKLLVPIILSLIFMACNSTDPTSSPQIKTGNITLQISASSSTPFSQLAKTAILTISAVDIITITDTLIISTDAISGTVLGIPAGKNRLFEVAVYDSTGTLQYEGSSLGTISADSTTSLSITISRIVGNANINGTIVESPSFGWTIVDGFEAASLNPNWKPVSSTSTGHLEDSIVHSGSQAFYVVTSDFRYLFPKGLTSGEISWWYYDNSGNPWSYFYALTDTTTDPSNLTNNNFNIVTDNPTTYSFYYPTVGYQNTLARSTGWHRFFVTVNNDTVTAGVDGKTGITYVNAAPIFGFQVSSAIMDDFYVVSNSN